MHGCASNFTRPHIHFHAGKGGPAQAIAPRPPADGNDQIARLRGCAMRAARQQPQAAAVHQGVCGVAGVINDRAVDGGDAHLVPVIFDAMNDAGGNAPWVEHASRQAVGRQIGGTKAEDVCVGNGAGADAQNVPHHAAHASVSSAKGLQGAGVVVGFDFESQVVAVGEGDDAGIVYKRRAHPGFLHQFCRPPDIGV